MIITIKNLRVETIIGFFPDERVKKQPVLITLRIDVDESQAVKSDNVDDSVDYNLLVNDIANKVSGSTFNLLESLTGFVRDIVMERKAVRHATIEVAKPEAPLEQEVEYVSVTCEATR